jgi:hypothetical protein
VYDFPGDDKKLSGHTKKRKSDESTMNNIARQEETTMEILDGFSMALVPASKEKISAQDWRSESGASEYSKKTKNDNAGLLKQPHVKK